MPDVNQDPGRCNARCNRNNVWSVNCAIKDSTGATLDISGYTWEAKIGAQAITITPIAGGLNLSLTAEETNGLAAGTYDWYLKRTNAGSERTWMAGKFQLFDTIP